MGKWADSRAVRKGRHRRVRKRMQGTRSRPRLSVFRSSKHIYAQIIDDTKGHTLAAASTLDPEIRGRLNGLKKTEQATLVGELIAKRTRRRRIKRVVFDRGGYLYHGRVKALAEAVREGGLDF